MNLTKRKILESEQDQDQFVKHRRIDTNNVSHEDAEGKQIRTMFLVYGYLRNEAIHLCKDDSYVEILCDTVNIQ